MSVTKTKNRIEWIDVMRGIAMVIVLLAHYDGGRLSNIANRACVQTFFFISGIFAVSSVQSVGQYIKKQTKALIFPYAVFAVVNIAFYYIFNPHTPVGELTGFAVDFVLARRNEVMVAAMWFLPCLFFASVLYKGILTYLKEQKYVVPLCFIISAVFKLWFEDPVYIFSINQGLKYLIYIALGGLLALVDANINRHSWKSLTNMQKTLLTLLFAVVCGYMWLLYKRGYVFWPQPIWALSVVYFINVVVCIIFVMVLSMALEGIKPLRWIGQNTLGFCCLENINRALLNTAMAVVGFGFIPNNEIKALVHIGASMCIGSVIILVIIRFCPQLLGKNKTK